MHLFHKSGLSLIEVVLVIAILAILATVGTISWLGFRGTAELDSTADAIVGLATEAGGNAVSGQGFGRWRVVVDNPTAGSSFVKLEQCNDVICTTPVEQRRIVLPSTLEFVEPNDGQTVIFLFKQRIGEISDASTKTFSVCVRGKSDCASCRKIMAYSTGLIETTRVSFNTTQPPSGTTIFLSGFETGDVNEWASSGNPIGDVRVDTQVKRTGTYSVRANTGSPATYARIFKNLSFRSALWARAYF